MIRLPFRHIKLFFSSKVRKTDLREREDLFEDTRNDILADYAGEEYEAYLEGLVANVSYTLNQEAYDRYTPKKLELE